MGGPSVAGTSPSAWKLSGVAPRTAYWLSWNSNTIPESSMIAAGTA